VIEKNLGGAGPGRFHRQEIAPRQCRQKPKTRFASWLQNASIQLWRARIQFSRAGFRGSKKTDLQQLNRVMNPYAEVMAGRKISNSRPLKTYLPAGGFGTATPPEIFKSMVKYALHVNGNAVKRWPADWPSLSIDELAPKLL
jgi:hypothetical protein